MSRLGVGLLVLLCGAGQGCGGSDAKCVEPTPNFSPAAITVDPSKRMADLTVDERAAVCAEFSRALTASFGTLEIECKFGSHAGIRQGQPTCPAWYDDCLQQPGPDPLSYCTDKMSGMWSCSATIGQYQACFNDLHSGLLTAIEVAQPCGGLDAPLCAPSTPPSCEAAPCDYVWYD